MPSSSPTIFQIVDDVVTGGYSTFQAYANNAYALASQSIADLQTFTFSPTPVSVDFNVVGGPGSFIEPNAPSRTISALVLPDEPPEHEIGDPALVDNVGAAPPPPPASTYVYRVPGSAPGELAATDPGDAPTFDAIAFPDVPALPEEPSLFAISVPAAPDITIPTWAGTAPSIGFVVPDNTFSFTETAYSSDLLTALKARLTLMLAGGTGLTAAIEAAIYGRARTREDENAFRALQEADEEFAGRGWEEPSGILAKRRLMIRQGNQNARNAASREVEIENKKLEIENMRFACTQVIGLESALLQAHLTIEERRYQSVRFAFEAVLQLFNARIVLFNAEIEGYKADAQVFRDRVQAALVEAEVYKAEVEGQKVIADVNKIIAEIFDIETRGIWERYKAEIDGKRAQIEANRAEIEGYRARVQAFAEHVRAYEAQWNGYAARVRAELGNVEAAKLTTDSYATSVGAWRTKYEVAFERLRGDIQIEDLKARKFDTDMRRFLGITQARVSEIQTQTQALSAEADVYSAAGNVAQARNAAQDRGFQLNIERGRSEAELRLKNGEINLQASLQSVALLLEAMKAVAQNSSQLAASALSAINISGSVSGSVGVNTSFNYSGDI